MLTLFGNLDSGNVHKVQMLLTWRELPYRRVDVSQARGETRRPEFLKLNPMGKIPALQWEDGELLTESGAIMAYLAHGTELWPQERRAQAEVLRWMFLEQYSHEPALAVLRYLRRFAPAEARTDDRLRELETKSCFVLSVLEQRLTQSEWMAGPRPTLADYALYPYTKWSDEAGVSLSTYSAIRDWCTRLEAQPAFLPLGVDGAQSVVEFDHHFARF
jgi:glutathione S-transferase